MPPLGGSKPGSRGFSEFKSVTPLQGNKIKGCNGVTVLKSENRGVSRFERHMEGDFRAVGGIRGQARRAGGEPLTRLRM